MKINNFLAGIYLVQIKFGMVSLTSIDMQANEYINYEKFITLLIQKFNEDQVNKINEALTTSNKLIIDFDKSVVKLIKEKDIKFDQYFASYFNAKAAEDWLENNEDFEDYLYKGD